MVTNAFEHARPDSAGTTEEMRSELDRYTLGRTHPLIVDLIAVTHLASAAVTALYRTPAGTALTLYAPAGSIAHHVLSLVGLPHVTDDPHHGSNTGTASGV
ncbi:hypothetical protein [Actinoplanes couchii]|uniref:STAS domain-containing protein n=1 Tax=Actinoplanes couchii TaxID=403638 RepID=A0ABQ3XI01_9ACTN|nr:hypothetical protein [Actinoplanes couchii]MDR6324590.1 hypothetical protein [Actinoplanes couchii]GID58142.1 hypothetical protein Aco03nite_065460 [Actinoplanes couchii]